MITGDKKNMEQKHKPQPPKSWRKVESNFYRFDKIGDSIEGLLTDKKIKQPNEILSYYHITDFNGKEIKFHGSTQLDDLMINVEVPCYVKITLVEQLPSKTEGWNPINIFSLEVGEN